MKQYNDEHIGFEMLPNDVLDLLSRQEPITEQLINIIELPLDEHELAMAA